MTDPIRSITGPKYLSTEERLARIETTLDEFRAHYATKTDVEKVKGDLGKDIEKAKSDLTLRIVLVQLAGLAAVAAIMRFLG